jgi:hypothetical protein
MLKRLALVPLLLAFAPARPQGPSPPVAWVNVNCSGPYAYHAGAIVTYPGQATLRITIDEDGPNAAGVFAETGYYAFEGLPVHKVAWTLEAGYWYWVTLQKPDKTLLFDSGWWWCP